MKKTVKKLTATLLLMLMLISVMGIHSFASFELVKVPEIEKVQLSKNNPSVSLKELDSFYEMLFEELKENDIDLETLKEKFPSIFNTLINFDLSYSGFDYSFDVLLNSGNTYTVSAKSSEIKYSKLYSMNIGAFISYDNYIKAKENNAKEIEITLGGSVYNNITYEDKSTYTSEGTLPLIDMVVKGITPVSGLPEKLYCDEMYIDLDGAEFLIEYADGSSKTAKIEQTITLNNTDYTYYSPAEYKLDDKEFSANYNYNYGDNDTDFSVSYSFSYLDAYYEAPANYVEESLFKAIKITDCDFDAEALVLKTISYELTYKDGKTIALTKDLTELESSLLLLGAEIQALDGYIVTITLIPGEFDDYYNYISTNEFHIELMVGSGYGNEQICDEYTVANPYANITNKAMDIVLFFAELISKVENFLYSVLDVIFLNW